MKPLFVKLSDEDSTLLDAITADEAANKRRPVSRSEVISCWIHQAADRINERRSGERKRAAP